MTRWRLLLPWVVLVLLGLMLHRQGGRPGDGASAVGVGSQQTVPAGETSPSRGTSPTPAVFPGPARGSAQGVVAAGPGGGQGEARRGGEVEFLRFHRWQEAYRSAPAPERPGLEEEGVELARARRGELKGLIRSDPERALQWAVTEDQRAGLPMSVQALLEERFSLRGDLALRCSYVDPRMTLMTGERGGMERVLETPEQVYAAHVYGSRSEAATRLRARVNGIAIDGQAAVAESPVRVVEGEAARRWLAANPAAVCEVTGEGVEGMSEPVVVDLVDRWGVVGGRGQLAALEDLVNAEDQSAAQEASPALAASPYTEGIKTVLVVRVDFSDLDGEPFSLVEAHQMITNVHQFYMESSYGRAGFAMPGEGSDVTPVFRMPRTAAYYGTNDPVRLRNDAREAARLAGYALGVYQFDLVCFGSVPGFKFSGLGYVGSPGAWIRGTDSTGVVGHELGHNFGLNHANFWETSGASVIGSGKSVEYGDSFDTMGSAGAGARHFNARYKSHLNWIRANEVLVASTNGIYRVHAHDQGRTDVPLGLRIPRDSRTNYWVEYRQKFTSNRFLMNGVGLRWAQASNQSSLLLDTTPGSLGAKEDSALLIGRTFSDVPAGVHITVLGKAPSGDNAMDVAVMRGAFAGNRAPQVALSASVTAPRVGADITLTATASDPDGDVLAYSWDFEDSTLGTNAPTLVHRWSVAGDYAVRCVVSDMKGGVSSAVLVIRVGSPDTYTIRGRVTTNGLPADGVRVSVSSTRVGYTDATGRYVITGLSAGSYDVRAQLLGYYFQQVPGPRSVGVGPFSAEGIDFEGSAQGDLAVSALVPAGSVWQFHDQGANLGTQWRQLNYNDSTWSEGPAPLGYGDDGERTQVSFGPSTSQKYVTTYFRTRFVVDDPSVFQTLSVGVRRDDGVVVYLNNTEIFRENLASGSLNYLTLATETVNGEGETSFSEKDLAPGVLLKGNNILAAEVHQVSRNSTDIVFDLRLTGLIFPKQVRPVLAAVAAAGGLTLSWSDPNGTTTLEHASTLGVGASWATWVETPALANGVRTVTVPFTQAQGYFRVVQAGALAGTGAARP